MSIEYKPKPTNNYRNTHNKKSNRTKKARGNNNTNDTCKSEKE